MTTDQPDSRRIRLRAEDAEDLKVIAACLQDAIVPITEICFLPEQRRFMIMATRFRWEACGDEPSPEAGGSCCERVLCAVSVLGVTAVRRRNINLLNRSLMLNLLSLLPAAEGLDLVFAGDSALHLTAPDWRCLIEDVGEPWPARYAPHHTLIDATP